MADEYTDNGVNVGDSAQQADDAVNASPAFGEPMIDIPSLTMPTLHDGEDELAAQQAAASVSEPAEGERTQAFNPLADIADEDTVAQTESAPAESAPAEFAQTAPVSAQPFDERPSIFPAGSYADVASQNGIPVDVPVENEQPSAAYGSAYAGAYDYGAQAGAVPPPPASAAQGMPPADDVATIAFEPVAMSAADAAALGAGSARGGNGGNGGAAVASKSPKSHRGRFIVFGLIAALLVAFVAAFFGANWYFQNRVAPGVHFGGVKVVGQTADELKTTVRQAVADSAITVTDSDGGKVKASLKDLGVTVDVNKTVNKLLAAKSDSMFARVNPFARQDVALVANTDDYVMSTYLTKQLVKEDDRAVASTIAYDESSKTFTVTDGKDGKAPQSKSVTNAIERAVSDPGQAQSVSVTYADVTMPVTVDTATTAAGEANQRLSAPVTITNSKSKSFTLPADEIAKWIKPTTDLQKGTITLSYDQDAIKTYLAANLPSQLNQEMVAEKNVTNADGSKVLFTLQKGTDGVDVENTDQTATDVVNALTAGAETTIEAKVKVTDHTVESRKVDYESPDGDPHMVINLSEQTAYAYKGSTLVKSFPVSTGKQSTPTDNGTFFVHTKYEVQTMRGEDYVTPNVPWVTYYNQGEGFHGAPWNSEGIASGTPKSHGCTNMYVADAKWVYDFMPVGAMVQVVGSTPDAAVRQ
ncbi:peptidoglycan-binding protein [Bifidobacterium goeldii]|uniref:Peptidoglycan-binding protein n=1 Tax=Bifidobacterium goeldii TaxID=2306975 RepID=A0A430FL12_9BIFI|nr:L,D-transpeptidase family protein [Bifidobacterium goeldii]RSX53442.1 peptidoglycan-binding protein [Bifidobacterium goeldii]